MRSQENFILLFRPFPRICTIFFFPDICKEIFFYRSSLFPLLLHGYMHINAHKDIVFLRKYDGYRRNCTLVRVEDERKALC